jgi:SAM-dependent methyltransferase
MSVKDQSMLAGPMTEAAHWDAGWTQLPTARFWSPFDAPSRDLQHVLKRYIGAGSKAVEFGYAPGKLLAWAAVKCGADVTGVDYSQSGVDLSKQFFNSLGVVADLRCEDLFARGLPGGTFDCAFSNGLIEHFNDPKEVVAEHVRVVRPGGHVVIAIPNYGGFWGSIQGRLDADNLSIHNLDIMKPDALLDLFDQRNASVTAYYYGRPSLWLLSLANRRMGIAAQRFAGLASNILPRRAGPLSSMLIAVARRL